MHVNKGFLQSCKKGVLNIKNTRFAIFKVQIHKKSFYENYLDLTSLSQDLGLFFRIYFLLDFIYWQPSYYFMKKLPWNPKHRTLYPVTFFPRTWENSDFFPKFLFPDFFRETFFLGTFLHRFFETNWNILISISFQLDGVNSRYFKYLMFTSLYCKNKWIRKSKFGANTQFL